MDDYEQAEKIRRYLASLIPNTFYPSDLQPSIEQQTLADSGLEMNVTMVEDELRSVNTILDDIYDTIKLGMGLNSYRLYYKEIFDKLRNISNIIKETSGKKTLFTIEDVLVKNAPSIKRKMDQLIEYLQIEDDDEFEMLLNFNKIIRDFDRLQLQIQRKLGVKHKHTRAAEDVGEVVGGAAEPAEKKKLTPLSNPWYYQNIYETPGEIALNNNDIINSIQFREGILPHEAYEEAKKRNLLLPVPNDPIREKSILDSIRETEASPLDYEKARLMSMSDMDRRIYQSIKAYETATNEMKRIRSHIQPSYYDHGQMLMKNLFERRAKQLDRADKYTIDELGPAPRKRTRKPKRTRTRTPKNRN